MVIKGISVKHFILYIKKVLKENLKMDEKQAKIAEQIKGILVDNLRIPAEELDYDVELFGDGIGLDSIDSLEIIAGIDQEFGVQMTGVAKENFFNIAALSKYVMEHMEA